MNRGKAPEAQRPAAADERHIEAVVSRMLHDRVGSNAGLITAVPPAGNNEEPLQYETDIVFNEAMETLGEEGLSAITDALDMFRKK